MKDYKFTKTTCERYDIRWGQYGWAIITIDENGGLFNCQSDYGNYNYSWPKHGRKSFKHFILEIARDWHYLLGKVAKRDHFDYESNLKTWKQKIIEKRKDRECTKELARDVWDFLTDIDYSLSVDCLQYEIYGNKAIGELFNEPWYELDMELDYSPSAMAFAQEIMQMFAEIIRQEIAEQEKQPCLTE